MLRLTFILCTGLFAALMIAGEDRGQLRPGLAEAAAKAALQKPEALAEADSSNPAPAEEPLTRVSAAATPAAVIAPVEAPAEPAVVARTEAKPVEPEPYVEPERELVTRVEEPVFSLASVGTETVPGAETPVVEPEVADGGTGTIWYVVANSVNVRAEPSTDGAVLGKLGSGEAALLVQAIDSEWARIVIQGDGVEGFVAMRYLSPEAP
jgi:Bacterial SH3 domain